MNATAKVQALDLEPMNQPTRTGTLSLLSRGASEALCETSQRWRELARLVATQLADVTSKSSCSPSDQLGTFATTPVTP